MKINVKLFLLCMVTLASCRSKDIVLPAEDAPSGKVHFQNDDTLGAVLDRAKDKDQLVFVDFYTDWCIGCKLMDQDVFTDRPMADFLNDNFVNYKVNAEKANGPDLAQLYGIQVYPTLLFLDDKGRVVIRKDGTAYFTELKKLGMDALALKESGSTP